MPGWRGADARRACAPVRPTWTSERCTDTAAPSSSSRRAALPRAREPRSTDDSGAVARDDFARLRVGEQQLQRVHDDPLLQRLVAGPSQAVPGYEPTRAESARRPRLRALLGLDGDQ